MLKIEHKINEKKIKSTVKIDQWASLWMDYTGLDSIKSILILITIEKSVLS